MWDSAGVHVGSLPTPSIAAGVAIHRDENAPSVVVSGPEGEQSGAFDVAFKWTERVRDFLQERGVDPHPVL